MRAVDFMLTRLLPEDMQEDRYDLTKKGLANMMSTLAKRHPDKYAELSHKISSIGREAAFIQGNTVGLDDMAPVIDVPGKLKQMDAEVDSLQGKLRDGKIDEDEFTTRRAQLFLKYSDDIESDTIQSALSKGNSFAQAVASGARGKGQHLKSLISTPGVYADAEGNIIPMFMRNSFANGVRPGEALAGTYGARTSTISTKKATAAGGDWGKILAQAGANITVTERDCGTDNGIDLDAQDASLKGRVLAFDHSDIPAGTPIDKRVLAKIRKSDKPAVVRSATTCQAANGICSKCAGLEATGKFYKVGDSLGITHAQALCLAEDTEVRMADGTVKFIQDIVPGDEVLGATKLGTTLPVKVLGSSASGEKECHEYTFRSGARRNNAVVLTSTADHKILSVYKGRGMDSSSIEDPSLFSVVPVGDLRTGTGYAVAPMGYDDTGHYNIPEARLLGVLAGDGCYTGGVQSGGIGLSCYDPDMLKDLVEDFALMGVTLSAMGNGEFRVTSLQGTNAPFQVTRTGEKVRHSLKRILINYDMWGQRSSDKKAPRGFHSWDNESVLDFIAGMIATDGYVSKEQRGVGITGNSFELLSCLRVVLRSRFGIRTSFKSSEKTKEGGGTYRPTWSLQIGGKSAIRKLNALLGSRIPGCKKVRLEERMQDMEFNSGSRESGHHFSLRSSKSVGIKKTYDIHVNHEDHLFVLRNGLIVSNSEPVTQAALNCLAEGTRVRMADFSVKPIQDIAVGDMVMGADLTGRTFPVRVTHTWDQGIQDVNSYVFKMGQTRQLVSIDCTKDHKILSNTRCSSCKEEEYNDDLRKLPAGYTTKKRFAAVLNDAFDDAGVKLKSEPHAFLLGLFLGDGVRHDRVTNPMLKFSCADELLAEDLRETFPEYNFKKLKSSFDYSVTQAGEVKQADKCPTTGRALPGLKHPLKVLLDDFGTLCSYALDKRIPMDLVHTWDNASVSALIAGYLAADGSVGSTKSGTAFVSFGSTSKGLLQDVKDLLRLRFGVHSSAITRTGKAGDGNRVNDMFALSVTQLPQIHKMRPVFDSLLGVKKERSQSVLCSNKSHMTPYYRARLLPDLVESVGRVHCYDITVAHKDELFVLENSMVVSNSKHTSGAATGKKEFSGFDALSQFTQIPSEFTDGAAVADVDAIVTHIKEAPQGGFNISLDGRTEPIYVPQGLDIEVKVGQEVEAGDALSDGLINPADIVKYKGLGRGRKYYINRMSKLLSDSGMDADRRNLETVARATLSHYRVEDPEIDSPYLPGDLVSESQFNRDWRPAEDSKEVTPHTAEGMFLQKPILHYTVGTRITPKMGKKLQGLGIDKVLASKKEPEGVGEMQRLRTASHTNDDWLASMQTSYLKGQLTDAAMKAHDTDIESNNHFAPRLAVGVGFGDKSQETGKF